MKIYFIIHLVIIWRYKYFCSFLRNLDKLNIIWLGTNSREIFNFEKIEHPDARMEGRRGIEKSSTWPPTTAMVGRDSQRVGKSLPPPWSPRAVQARWMRFINPIRPSMDAITFFFLICFPKFTCFPVWVELFRCVAWRREGAKDDWPDEEEGSKTT